MHRSSSSKIEQLKALKNGQGIKHILDIGYELLGNPIAMYDTSYNLLAYTQGVVTDDSLWNELITRGTFSHESVDFFNQEHFIEAYAQSDIVVMLKSDKLKYDRMNGKLFDRDNVQLGDIIIVACFKPFEQGDDELIEILSGLLSVELQNSEFYQKIDRVYQESLLDELIEGNMQINDVKRNRLAELYGDLKSNLYLAVVDISQYEQTITHLAYFRDLFRKMQPEHKYIIHLFNIVVIISIDDETLNIGRDLGKLNEFFMKYNIYSGVSSAFQNLEELKKRHREAIVALNYGLESSRSQRCFCYENYRVRHLLYSSGNYVDTPENPIVRSMLLYDRENRTRYLELLYSYLLNGQDVPTVCDALDMNPNEVQKKLKTMQELFEIDWKSEDMLNVLSSIKTVQHDDCDE